MNYLKSLMFPVALGASLLTSCSTDGYKINGVVVADGFDVDSVALCDITDDGQPAPIVKAPVENGKFTFEGRQDSLKRACINCMIGEKEAFLVFILENGNINAYVSIDSVSATGTPNNDIYEDVRIRINNAIRNYNDAYAYLRDTTLTAEERTAGEARVPEMEKAFNNTIKNCVKENITNPVGLLLFKEVYRHNTLEENDSLIQAMPEETRNDKTVQKVAERIAAKKATAVGQPYTDFTLNDMEGNAVKLSDYVTPGRVVLVDFWASWCGPCRHEIPALVELYKKYKGDSFEIIGVSLDDEFESWKEATEALGIIWPQMSDLKGWKCEASQAYSVHAIPCTILIDGEGNIAARDLRGEKLAEKVAELLDK